MSDARRRDLPTDARSGGAVRQILPQLLRVLLLALMVVADPATPSAFAAPPIRAYRAAASVLGAAVESGVEAAVKRMGKFRGGDPIRPAGKAEPILNMDAPSRGGWSFTPP